jgi:dihydroflavonol-4-reductase
MRVAVTGGTGHIGIVLVRRLLADGHAVRVLVRDGGSVLDGLAVERIRGDVRDPTSLRAAFDGQDVVLHLAAMIEIRKQDEPVVRAINVDGVRNTAEAALDAGVRRMVHVSSVHAYDTWRLGAALREDGARAGRSHPAYDRSKADGEAELRKVIARGLDATIVNPVGVLGPWDHRPSLLGHTVMQMYRGRFRFVPNGGFCWVDVRDVVDAAIRAIDRGDKGANHLLSAGSLSLRQMHGFARGKRGGSNWHLPLPLRVLRRIPPVLDRTGLARFSPPNFTSDALFTLGSRLAVDTSRARAALGFSPRPPRESLSDAIDWWREQGHLS